MAKFLQMGERGSALIAGLIFALVITLLGMALFDLSVLESRLVIDRRSYAQALQIAEAGLERAFLELSKEFNTVPPGDEDFSDGDIGTSYGSPGSCDSTTTTGDTAFGSYLSGAAPGGNFTICVKRIAGNKREIWLRSKGVAQGAITGDVTRIIEVRAAASPFAGGDALFAGKGGFAKTITGNTRIAGSMLIVGTPGVTAIEFGGGGGMRNNYADLPNPTIKNRVPPLPKVDFGGESNLESISAGLRVVNGQVLLSSNSASIGLPNVTGNGIKETVKSVFVNDGFGGSHGNCPAEETGGPCQVYSDNGTKNKVENSGDLRFPILDCLSGEPAEDCRAKVTNNTGAKITYNCYFNASGACQYGGNDYFYNNSLRISASSCDVVGDPNCATALSKLGNLQPPDPSFTVTFTAAACGRMGGTACVLQWSNDTGQRTLTATIDGNTFQPGNAANPAGAPINIYFDGNLSWLPGPGPNDLINYSGKMAFLVKGNTVIDNDMLTANINTNPCTATDVAGCAFISKDFLGVMVAKGGPTGTNQLSLGPGAKRNMIGVFYAEYGAIVSKDTNVAGTVSANTLTFNNVPYFFQVPLLLDKIPDTVLPPFGGKGFSIGTVGNTWREIVGPVS